MPGEWRLRPRAQVDANGSADGARVLLDTYSATLYDCNDTAWLLLEALAEGATLEALVDRLVETFDVSQDDARRDAERFVHQLRQMGLANAGA